MCRKAVQTALGNWCETQGNVSRLLRLHMVGMRIEHMHVECSQMCKVHDIQDAW